MKDSFPKVSVIVPVYNVERYLRRCLDSLVAQTLTDIEIVCVDDGSPDRSFDILNEYAARDGRVKVFRRPNGGLAAARNTGMDHAIAPYLMFCDSDDWVEPTWCEELYGAIDRSGADFAVARAFIDGECPRARRRELELHQVLRFPEGLSAVTQSMMLILDHAVWIRIFRRSLIERYGLRFPEGTVCEDWPFSQEYLAVSSSAFLLDRRLYHYFQRSGSILNDGAKAIRCDLDFLSQWVRLQRFLKAFGRWNDWKGVLLGALPDMVGKMVERNSDQSGKVYAMADAFLDGLSPEDLDGMEERMARGLRMIRDRTVDLLKNKRWGVGPLTLAKLKRTPLEKKVYFLGVRILRRRFA